MADAIDKATEVFQRNHQTEDEKAQRKLRNERRLRNTQAAIHPACIARIKHEGLNYYPAVPRVGGDDGKKVGFYLAPIPSKIEDVLMLKMRDEWTRRGVAAKDPEAQKDTIRDKVLGLDLMRSYRRLRPVHPLARYLADAAKLFEAIASYGDEKVIAEYLFPKKLPQLHLHPRRTLDQSKQWQLKTTRRRDRDQVVYRSTAARFAHQFRHDGSRQPQATSKRACKLQKTSKADQGGIVDGESDPATNDPGASVKCQVCSETCGPRWESMAGWRWTNHTERENELACIQCRNDITKVACLVMVDQLWMWILDENTILTCFPERYGATRKVPSGVNYSIRKRLADPTNSSNQVCSVFDLGLIILDECFDTFFDRIIKPDGCPQVMDIFAEAIGDVVRSFS